jgi:hypothetical protein
MNRGKLDDLETAAAAWTIVRQRNRRNHGCGQKTEQSK